MTRGPKIPQDAADDSTDSDMETEADRAEVEWLLAREQDPSRPAPSTALGAEHAELQAMLASLPDASSDDAWQAAVVRRMRSAPPAVIASPPPWWRRRWLQWGVGGGIAAAMALAIWLLSRPVPPELEVAVVSRIDRRSGDVGVGDQLVVRARSHGSADLRVFGSSGELLARCPGGPACTVMSSGDLKIEVRLDAPGRYHVILASGLKQRLPESSMDTYIDAARATGAHIAVREIEAH